MPFAITFDRQGRLVVAEAATSSLTTYQLHGNGTVTPVASVANGQAALCWVVLDRGFAFGANTGSGTVRAIAATEAAGSPWSRRPLSTPGRST